EPAHFLRGPPPAPADLVHERVHRLVEPAIEVGIEGNAGRVAVAERDLPVIQEDAQAFVRLERSPRRRGLRERRFHVAMLANRGNAEDTCRAASSICATVCPSMTMPPARAFRYSRSGSPGMRTPSAPGAGRAERTQSSNCAARCSNSSGGPIRAGSKTMASMLFHTRSDTSSPSTGVLVSPPVKAAPSISQTIASA